MQCHENLHHTFVSISANFDSESLARIPAEVENGVYYGWAQVENGPVYKMVMCLGWNPFYKNKEKSMVGI